MEFEAIVRHARRHDRFESNKAADAVIDMHDEIAGGKRPDFGEDIGAALAFAALAHETVA